MSVLPKLIVFDLDACIWLPEVYELPSSPSIPVVSNGLVSALRCSKQSGRGGRGRRGDDSDDDGDDQTQTLRLFPATLALFQDIFTNRNGIYKGVQWGVASSSLQPDYSHLGLELLEVFPGQNLKSLFDPRLVQVGRTGKLTSRKTTHFALLKAESGIEYSDMLFFDDCGWDDHVADLNQALGVVGVRTPTGVGSNEFLQGLALFQASKQTKKQK